MQKVEGLHSMMMTYGKIQVNFINPKGKGRRRNKNHKTKYVQSIATVLNLKLNLAYINYKNTPNPRVQRQIN